MQKSPLLKRVVVIPALQKKNTHYLTYNGAEGGERLKILVKPQSNHDKKENTTSQQTITTRIRLKI